MSESRVRVAVYLPARVSSASLDIRLVSLVIYLATRDSCFANVIKFVNLIGIYALTLRKKVLESDETLFERTKIRSSKRLIDRTSENLVDIVAAMSCQLIQ